MSQINFRTRDDEGTMVHVQTGWDRINQGFHLTVWVGDELDRDAPSIEKDPPFDKIRPYEVFNILESIGAKIDHRKRQQIELMLYNHRAMDLGNHIDNLGELK